MNEQDPKIFNAETVAEDALQRTQQTALERVGSIQQTRAAYTTAVAVTKPRNIKEVHDAVMTEARLAGDAFFNYLPGKDKKTGQHKTVTVASAEAVKAVARNMGNCVLDLVVEEKIGQDLFFRHHVVDLETGFTATCTFRDRLPKKVMGDRDDHEYAKAYSSALARATRNALRLIVPGYIVLKAVDAAVEAAGKSPVEGGIDGMINSAMKYLAGHGVSIGRIEQTLGKKMSELTPADLNVLRNYLYQIKAEAATAEQLFPEVKTAPEPDAPAAAPSPEPPAAAPPKAKKPKPEPPAQTVRNRFELLPPAQQKSVLADFTVDSLAEALSLAPDDLQLFAERIEGELSKH